MSIRDNSFFNPFKNWPFSGTPGVSGSNPACTCPVDLVGFNINNIDRHQQQCLAKFAHSYPPGFDALPPRQIPTVKITRPDGETIVPVERKTAIDSLKACAVNRSKSNQPTQNVDRRDRSAGMDKSGSKTVASGMATGYGESNKENEHRGHNSTQQIHHDGSNEQSHSRGPMQSVVNRSVSMSTINSSDRTTIHSWKNSSLASDSQTTISSIADGSYKEPKGKEKAWQPQSPGFDHSMSHNAVGRVTNRPEPYTSTRDDNSQLREISEAYATAGYGKMVLGCSQCLFDPKLRVIPCGCLVCTECGGRFWGSISHGNEVLCGCGETVTNMSKIEPPSQPQVPVTHSGYPQTTMYSSAPYTPSACSSTAAVHYTSPTPASRYHYSPMKMDNAATSQPHMSITQIPGNPVVPIGLPLNSSNMSRVLMDAETAIQNAPFVNLGKNSLPQNWSCVKIGNIPYNVTSEELIEFLGKSSNIVPDVAGSIGVHVIMDRSTGKTMDAYVEFLNAKDAWKCVSRRRSRVLGNRHLSLDIVDPAELMKDVFPRAKGIVWDGVVPKPSTDKSEFGSKTEVISREELVLIVNHARTPHRSPFSRKCLQRPFQSLMSIVSKFPWFAVDLYTIQQRDYVFQALLSAVDILKRQIKRGRTMPNLDIDLLKALLHVGIRCAGFTDTQKYELVKTAEFGAEGIRVDADIGILSGFEALGKAVGAERKVLEFYALLLELSVSPFLDDSTLQGLAASELVKSRNITKQLPEEGNKSHLTMAEASALEWTTIFKAVNTVLPGKLSHTKAPSKIAAAGWREIYGK